MKEDKLNDVVFIPTNIFLISAGIPVIFKPFLCQDTFDHIQRGGQ